MTYRHDGDEEGFNLEGSIIVVAERKPVAEWSTAQMILFTAYKLGRIDYIGMTDHERHINDFPATRHARMIFLQGGSLRTTPDLFGPNGKTHYDSPD